jgi:PAS domain S-box-containing protein
VAEIEGEKRALVINAVLRIALRHPNLLQRQAFQELVDAVGRVVPVAQIALSLPDGLGAERVYAISPGPGEAILPYGGRYPMAPDIQKRVYGDALPYYCNDTRLGDDRSQMAAKAGYLSYVIFPARSGGTVRGGLIAGFRTLEGAAEAPAALLQEIADLVGENLERIVRMTRERRLAMILETSDDAMLAWDRAGVVTDANVAASTLTGMSRNELIGTPIADLLGPQSDTGGMTPPPSQGIRMELAKRRSGDALEKRVTVAATITSVEDDPLVAAHVLLRDLSHVVTAERQAALRLARIRELEEQHRTLLDNAPLIIFRLDPQATRLVYLNRHAERLLGVPTGEALGTHGFLRSAHADPEGVAAFDSAVARARSGAESLPYEARLRRRYGEEIMARGTVYPLLSERGEVVAIEGVLADVSAEHAARTRLVQTDRLSTLGMLAAGVAHEINNPAAFLLLGLDMLDRLLAGAGVTMDDGARTNASALVTELRDSIKRIVDIARDLRLFASPPTPGAGRWAVVDVNRTIESALTLTRGQIIERAQIVQSLADVPPVLMRDGRLGQVLVNLLVNASQAIPKTYPSDHTISVTTRSDGAKVEIEVVDTGVGISQENLSRIWTPFFTTKSSDVGTGLGLSISREIIEQASGTIVAESPVPGSDPPRGSRFVISLPAAGRVDQATQSTFPPPARAPQARARVLIVEDEPALARALADEIGAVHDVVIAENATAALEVLSRQSFDAVLCDLRMPGMTGDALFGKVAEANPPQAARFIFMTGVGFGAGVERFLSSSGRPVLEKPFPADAALTAIAKVVGKHRRASSV